MLKNVLLPAALLVLGASAASAEDWTGQTTAPPVNGTLGPIGAGGSVLLSTYIEACNPGNTPPPCSLGQAPIYSSDGSFQEIPAIPGGGGPGSNVGIFAQGTIADPNSPTGVSWIEAHVPLDAFARSSSVDALAATTRGLSAQVSGLGGTLSSLTTTVNELGGTVNGLAASVSGLSSQMHTLSTGFAQLQQQLAIQDRSLRQGVAMSLAMAGTGALARDENFAMSANLGTFGGQNGVAGSVAVRAADHVTFDGGIGTGLHGGLVGARAGVRFAW